MRQLPLICNTDVVRAIDSGVKKQTRRMQGIGWINDMQGQIKATLFSGDDTSLLAGFKSEEFPLEYFSVVKCPFGNVGDLLYVRETWGMMDATDDFEFPVYKAQEDECGQVPSLYEPNLRVTYKENWIPSIHMPKIYARIWLKITNIRIEHLQDITAEDAIAEGIKVLDPWPEVPDRPRYLMYDSPYDKTNGTFDPIASFFTLWCSIYGQYAVIRNPWVWVIEFEKVEKPIP